jgi:hypothetical protein
LAALISPVQNIFFLIVQYFNSFVPITQQDGQAVVPGRLSLNKSTITPPSPIIMGEMC